MQTRKVFSSVCCRSIFIANLPEIKSEFFFGKMAVVLSTKVLLRSGDKLPHLQKWHRSRSYLKRGIKFYFFFNANTRITNVEALGFLFIFDY